MERACVSQPTTNTSFLSLIHIGCLAVTWGYHISMQNLSYPKRNSYGSDYRRVRFIEDSNVGDIFFIADPSQDPSRLRSLGQSQWEGHESVWALNLLMWQKRENGSVVGCERSVITIILLRLGYLVHNLGNRTMILPIETGLMHAWAINTFLWKPRTQALRFSQEGIYTS